jgi:hypothetical protein
VKEREAEDVKEPEKKVKRDKERVEKEEARECEGTEEEEGLITHDDSPIVEYLIFGTYYFMPEREGIIYPIHCQTCKDKKRISKGYRIRATVMNPNSDESTVDETILCQKCFTKLCERWITRVIEDIRDSHNKNQDC